MVKKKPPREVTFPIRPHWFGVGLFAAGILRRIRTGQDEETQICHTGRLCGPGPCVIKTKRHGTL